MSILQRVALCLLCACSSASAGLFDLPADISVDFAASPSTGLVPGQPIEFTISVTNHGPEPADFVVVSSFNFTTEFYLGGAHADCQNSLGLAVADGENFYFYYYDWYLTDGGDLEVGETRTCHLTLPLSANAPATFPFGFGVPEFFTDIDPSNNSASVTLRRAREPAIAVPASSRPALTALAVLVALLGGVALAKRSGTCEPGRRMRE